MKYVYVSPALPDSVFGSLLGYGKGSPGQQAQKYNKLLGKGISLCGRDLLMLSAPPVPPGSRPFRLIKLKDEKDGAIPYKFLKVLDIPKVKNIYTYFQARKEIKLIAKGSGGDICVVCDLLTLSASLGALRAAKKLGLTTCGIVTDLPVYLSGKPSTDSYGKTYAKAVACCDSFVLLTDNMADALPVSGRPYVVIEGISTPLADTGANEPLETGIIPEGRFILYAGGIEKKYGVEKLVKAFLKANIYGCELVLCGSGSYADELEKISALNTNIKYLGVIPNEKVMVLEKKAALLVNPRTSEGEFTVYSFPSKNIEYMSTGTPVLAYLLPGIPPEYGEFFITPAGESEEELSMTLRETLAADEEELRLFGQRAKAFALEKKSPEAQARLLINMAEYEAESKKGKKT